MQNDQTSTGINFALLFIRIALGITFIVHGFQKFQNMAGTVGFFESLNLAPYMAHVVAYAEVIAGSMVLLGLFTSLGAVILAVVLAFAIYLVKAGTGFAGGYELDFVLLLSSLALLVAGGGKISLDTTLSKRRR